MIETNANGRWSVVGRLRLKEEVVVFVGDVIIEEVLLTGLLCNQWGNSKKKGLLQRKVEIHWVIERTRIFW
jgi:hypothetical protein